MISLRLVLLLVGLCAPALAAAEVRHFLRFEFQGVAAYGLKDGSKVLELAQPPFAAVVKTGRSFDLSAVKILPPTVPRKVIALAMNFASHGSGGGRKPELFAKLPTSIAGHGADIVLQPDATNVHYEGELVAVIGRHAKNVSLEAAPAVVFGVTAGNDLSDRTWQSADVQWLRAKGADGFGPVGPFIATGLDYDNLMVRTRVNGEQRQAESTANLLHSVAKVVSFTSRYITLEPGDLIFMGTPGRTQRLSPGDVVEVEVDGVGVLRNRIVQGN
jgi:2-keto-4-pentenoate hydratase/2-oxohepta-3-ene-1,7-dioic acid hydratase in catechol pathway